MKHWKKVAAIMMLVPMLASAQYQNLDAAIAGLERGFEQAQSGAILAGVASNEQIRLEFPGLVDKSGFFGRDQAAFLLDELFQKTGRGTFERLQARKVSSAKQYQITARWTVERGAPIDLYITLGDRGDSWSVVSIRSAGR